MCVSDAKQLVYIATCILAIASNNIVLMRILVY